MRWARWAALALPAVLFLHIVGPATSGQLLPRNSRFTAQDIPVLEACARWINERATADDYVIANPDIAWLLKARVTHQLQVVAGMGVPTHGFERGINPNRFRFDTNFRKARFVVIDDVDIRWTLSNPGVGELWQRLGLIPINKRFVLPLPISPECRDKIAEAFAGIEPEKWPVVWQRPGCMVLANPRFIAASGP